MITKQVKFWTGPTLVKAIADRMREAGIVVDIEGTEHVYCQIDGWNDKARRYNVCAMLYKKHGTDFGLK